MRTFRFIHYDRYTILSIAEESLWCLPEAINLYLNFKYEFCGEFEKNCWLKNSVADYRNIANKCFELANLNKLSFYSSKGSNDEKLTKYQYTAIDDDGKEHLSKEKEIFVKKNDFIKFINEYLTEIENKQFLKFITDNWRKNSITKITNEIIVQVVAKTLWDIYPDMKQEDMMKHNSILLHAGGRLIDRDNTLREWLSKVDPRDPAKKPGTKKKEEN